MKKPFFAVLLMIVCISSFAQSGLQIDQRVTAYFGQDKINEWTASSPDSIKYYNFIVSSSFEIWTEENFNLIEKPVSVQEISMNQAALKALDQPQEFNILTIGVVYSQNDVVWYRIQNSNYFLKLESLSFIEKKYRSGK